MKRHHLSIAAALLAAGTGAQAQSNVALYGIIDASVRYTSNANAAGDKRYELNGGSLSGNRWGLRGTEDLGGGLKGLFVLESGFNTDTGAAAQQGQLFGRQALVGVQGGFGAVTLGRQNTIGYDAVGAYLPLGWTNLSDDINWGASLTGQRSDNAIRYAGNFSGLQVAAQYAFGEVAGSPSKQALLGASLGYAAGPVAVNAFYQQATDASTAKARQKTFGLGGSYAFGPAKLFAGYVNAKTDAGFVPGSASTSPATTLSTASLLANGAGTARRDNLYLAGLNYTVAPAVTLTLAYQYDKVKDVAANTDGRRSTIYGVADYTLSKRTDVYLLADYNRTGGGLLGTSASDPAAKLGLKGAGANDSRLGVAVGLRHRF